MENNQV